jgi:hypothetical protein
MAGLCERCGWVTKIYNLKFLHASESICTHPLQVQGGLTSGRPVVKTIAESLPQHDEKHVVPTPLSGKRVGKRKLMITILIKQP